MRHGRRNAHDDVTAPPEQGRGRLIPDHAVGMDAWPLDAMREFRVELVEKGGRWYVSQIIFVKDDRDPTGERAIRGFWLQVQYLERLAAAIEKTRRGAVGRYLIDPLAPAIEDAAA